MEGVVPGRADIVLGEIEGGHAGIGNGLAGLVDAVVAGGADGEAGLGGGPCEIAEHGLPGDKGMTGPGLADRAEQAVLDRVPLGAAGRVVADGDLSLIHI